MISVVEIPQSWPLGPSSCRDCGAPIVWAVTDAGRRLPVDLHPDPQGSLELFTEHFPGGEPVEVGVQRVRTRPADRPPASPAWTTHWATCPARRWGPLFARLRGN